MSVYILVLLLVLLGTVHCFPKLSDVMGKVSSAAGSMLSSKLGKGSGTAPRSSSKAMFEFNGWGCCRICTYKEYLPIHADSYISDSTRVLGIPPPHPDQQTTSKKTSAADNGKQSCCPVCSYPLPPLKPKATAFLETRQKPKKSKSKDKSLNPKKEEDTNLEPLQPPKDLGYFDEYKPPCCPFCQVDFYESSLSFRLNANSEPRRDLPKRSLLEMPTFSDLRGGTPDTIDSVSSFSDESSQCCLHCNTVPSDDSLHSSYSSSS